MEYIFLSFFLHQDEIVTTNITLGLIVCKFSLKSQKHLHFLVLISFYFIRLSLLVINSLFPFSLQFYNIFNSSEKFPNLDMLLFIL